MSNVFVIINEWTDIAETSSSEVTGDNYFTSESAAWDALKVIADTYLYDLAPDATSIVLENHTPSLNYEEYYIQELTEL